MSKCNCKMSNCNCKIKRVYNVIIERLPHEKLDFLKLPKIKKPTASPIVDLRNKMPPVYDQGNLGSCTANALCGLVSYSQNGLLGSRLFLYYNERMVENSIPYDAGATLYDGIKCLQNYGICQETQWPYIISKYAVKPPPNCYKNALKHNALQVKNIPNDINSMKACLDSGFPFVFGFLVYSSFESSFVAKTGIVPMPNTKTEQLQGGHAVVCCGYDDTKQVWIVRNSWGTSWGDNGYCYFPYNYLTSNLCSDLWNITKME